MTHLKSSHDSPCVSIHLEFSHGLSMFRVHLKSSMARKYVMAHWLRNTEPINKKKKIIFFYNENLLSYDTLNFMNYHYFLTQKRKNSHLVLKFQKPKICLNSVTEKKSNHFDLHSFLYEEK